MQIVYRNPAAPTPFNRVRLLNGADGEIYIAVEKLEEGLYGRVWRCEYVLEMEFGGKAA